MIEERGSATVVWQQGPRHKFYEDRYRLLCRSVPLVGRAKNGEIFAVCDGVGSAPRGRDAAQEVCDTLVKFYDPTLAAPATDETMHALLQQANETIQRWGVIADTDRPQGACAATIIWVDEPLFAHVFHVGDTSALLIRDGTAQALTTSHNDVAGHLTNYFGLPKLQVETKSIKMEDGDRLLLMSDGITKSLYNQKIANIVETHSRRSASLEALLSAARNAGSGDDITAILVDIEEN